MQITEMNYPADIGIANIIKAKGLKQFLVAEKAGLGKQELNDMLKGRKIIKACDLKMLARALDVTVSDIYAAGEECGS